MSWADGMLLQSRALTARLGGGLDAGAEWTMEGAPTVTLTVPDGRTLLRGGLLDHDQDHVLDRGTVLRWRDVPYRLVQAKRSPAGRVPLVFEDEVVELLRRHSGYRRASRDDGTRAEFVLSLLQEVQARRIEWDIPDLHRKQRIAAADDVDDSREERDYYFERGQPGDPEDTWTCTGRLASEVERRRYVIDGLFHYVSDTRLMAAKTSLTVSDAMPGVDRIEWDVDAGKEVATATVSLRSRKPLVAPPGAVVELADEGLASGRWLVGRVRQERLASDALVLELRQPVKPKPEPAAETYTPAARAVGVTGAARHGVPESIERAYARAKAIDARGQAYFWGGGHGDFDDPRGYDCSGFVSSLLHAGGLLDVPLDTGGLTRWGEPGQGAFMTVWVHETGDPRRSHAFVTFDLNHDGRQQFAEAGGAESGRTGFHRPRSTAGFVPRHAGGT